LVQPLLAYESCLKVRVDYHRLFDDGKWLLLPENDIVKKFFDSTDDMFHFADRDRFPDFPVSLLII